MLRPARGELSRLTLQWNPVYYMFLSFSFFCIVGCGCWVGNERKDGYTKRFPTLPPPPLPLFFLPAFTYRCRCSVSDVVILLYGLLGVKEVETILLYCMGSSKEKRKGI